MYIYVYMYIRTHCRARKIRFYYGRPAKLLTRPSAHPLPIHTEPECFSISLSMLCCCLMHVCLYITRRLTIIPRLVMCDFNSGFYPAPLCVSCTLLYRRGDGHLYLRTTWPRLRSLRSKCGRCAVLCAGRRRYKTTTTTTTQSRQTPVRLLCRFERVSVETIMC